MSILVLAGCSSDERVDTVSVLALPNCKANVPGLREVSLPDVARLRGSELLTTPDAATSAPADQPRFIAISRGVQPSRGFEVHLADQATVSGDQHLTIPVYWTAPDPGKSHPLVNTQPCLVVSVPNRPWKSAEAIDQHDESLGTLQFVAPDPTDG